MTIFYIVRLSLPNDAAAFWGTNHTGRSINHHALVGDYITWSHSVVLPSFRGDLIVSQF
jgi:hypothetical protein